MCPDDVSSVEGSVIYCRARLSGVGRAVPRDFARG